MPLKKILPAFFIEVEKVSSVQKKMLPLNFMVNN